MLDIQRLDPPPAGFGKCSGCPYLDHGAAAICFACASSRLEPLAELRCDVCDLELGETGLCQNPVCNFSDRGFRYVYAISMMTGPLRKAILRYKYEDVRRWADIFGRVLAGYLDENEAAFKRFDIIAPSPTYVGSGGREWDHTEAIVQVAADESETDWPFQLERPYVIEQVRPTPRFVEQKRWQDRRHLAEGEFRRSLLVPDQDRVSGQSILLIDDVFTDGLRTREVALALQSQGATEVSQVVLARQPYRPKS